MAYLSTLLFIAFLGIVLHLVFAFNRLVSLKNQYINAFSQIDVQLQRRYDLIPNLVEIAKTYLKHERETLELVVKARNQAMQCLDVARANPGNAVAISSLGEAEQGLANALGKLNVVVEAYPELKANTNMMQLHEEISSTENRVAFARQAYNDSVMGYNAFRQSFPQNIFAGSVGHGSDAVFLQLADNASAQQVPKVSF